MWAQVVDGQLVSVSLDSPIEGWSEVTPTARPMDTATLTWDSGVTVTDGVPVQTWTSRAWRAGELSDEYRALLEVRDVRDEYAEQIAGAIEAFRTAKDKCLDSSNPSGLVLLDADLAAWTPSGVTADDFTAMRDFMVRFVGIASTHFGDAFRGGEVYGRALWGIGPAE